MMNLISDQKQAAVKRSKYLMLLLLAQPLPTLVSQAQEYLEVTKHKIRLKISQLGFTVRMCLQNLKYQILNQSNMQIVGNRLSHAH